jgi:hypothetical protein
MDGEHCAGLGEAIEWGRRNEDSYRKEFLLTLLSMDAREQSIALSGEFPFGNILNAPLLCYGMDKFAAARGETPRSTSTKQTETAQYLKRVLEDADRKGSQLYAELVTICKR